MKQQDLKRIKNQKAVNREWQPSQQDIDWRYMTKEEFLKKYPEEAKWYGPPPPEDKFIW